MAKGVVVRRGRVGEGRLGSDLAALGDRPRGQPEDRRGAGDGERGPVRRRLARTHPPRATPRRWTTCWTLRPTRPSSTSSELPLADGPRPRRDARNDRRLVDRRALPRHSGRRAIRPRARSRAAAVRAGDRLASRTAGRAERRHRTGVVVPRRRDLRPLRPGRRRRGHATRRAPDGLHAVPARDEPGRPAGDLRVPDRDLRADRDGRLQRVRLRRDDGRRGRLLRREARHGTLTRGPRRNAQPAGSPGRQDLRTRVSGSRWSRYPIATV